MITYVLTKVLKYFTLVCTYVSKELKTSFCKTTLVKDRGCFGQKLWSAKVDALNDKELKKERSHYCIPKKFNLLHRKIYKGRI